MEKSQKWTEAELSTHSPYQKKKFGTSRQNLRRNSYQSFSPAKFCLTS